VKQKIRQFIFLSRVEYAARIASLIIAALVIAAGIFSVLIRHYLEGAVVLLARAVLWNFSF